MNHKGTVIVEGTIVEAMPNTLFRVDLDSGQRIIASVAGKMRRNFIRILPGDRVKLEMTHYDKERGRIIFRYK
ncbi:translation initiation factor IF-1 [Candidatus Microgenomates bacterium]|nr:translation initiation factor IF-1 [Candidatus Microgenomates bacterium]